MYCASFNFLFTLDNSHAVADKFIYANLKEEQKCKKALIAPHPTQNFWWLLTEDKKI